MNKGAAVRALLAIFFVSYPFLVYFGIQVLPPSFFGLVLIALLAMRFGVLRPEEKQVFVPVLLIFFAYAIAAAVSDSEVMILFYPALVNFSLCFVFLRSLKDEESLLLRVVKARGVEINEHVPGYLRRLTGVWAGFFVVNGIISIWTVSLSLQAWTLYNGLISYLVVAILAGGELLFRWHFKKRKGIT
jgi:uncharacterized membrane protein